MANPINLPDRANSDTAATQPIVAPTARRCGDRSERILFLILVAVELLSAVFLSYCRFIPAQWDSLQYFQVQYYFLNAAVTSGHAAQWLPFVTHGQIANWWYALQASILQSALIPIAPLLGHVDLLWCFHAGIFVDKMVLLCGMWLLCRRLSLSSTATFIASLCAVGSVVWMDQIYWNLHLYYAVPLIFYFGHRFLDTGRWRYFVAAGNLLAVQTWGNLPYFIPVITLVIAVYFSAVILFDRDRVLPLARRLRWRWAAPSVIAVAAPLWLSYWFLTIGTSQIANFSEDRMADGSASLDVFLKYGGNLDFIKWTDAFIGLSPAGDFTLYFGMAAAALALVGVAGAMRKDRAPLVVLTIFLFLFFSATHVSVAAYFLWPGMKYFRHLALLAPLQKVIFCILGGVGFDYLFPADRQKNPRLIAGTVAVIMAMWSLVLWKGLHDGTFFHVLRLGELVMWPLSADLELLSRTVIRFVLVRGIYLALIVSALFALAASGRRRDLCKAIFACVIFLDVSQFQFTQTVLRGTTLSNQQASLTMPADLPYAAKRVQHYSEGGPRVQQYGAMARQEQTYYCSTNLFVFLDEAGHEFRTDYWMRPFDRLLRAFANQDLNSVVLNRKFKQPFGELVFPPQPTGLRIAGVTEPKIQFFTHAYAVDSPKQLAKLLPDPSFKGDLLFVEGTVPQAKSWDKSGISLSASERLSLSYEVTHFDSNDLDVTVENTTNAPCWLMYSDVWHPFWQATVNDHPAPVLCADLAYKAVPIGPGTSRVHLEFYSRAIDWVEKFQRLNAAMWLGVVLWLMYRIGVGKI